MFFSPDMRWLVAGTYNNSARAQPRVLLQDTATGRIGGVGKPAATIWQIAPG
jgi:hypothetical protein